MSEITITKIPLKHKTPIGLPNFIRMPRLYLELLENPSKVKQSLVGKDDIIILNKQPESSDEEEEEHESSEEEEDGGDSSDGEVSDIIMTADPINVNPTVSPNVNVNVSPNPIDIPPTLKEIRKTNTKLKISDYKYPQEEDDETIKKRNDVFFQYEVLKRMHPTSTIPEFTAFTNPVLMEQKYNELAKRLSLDTSVETWKKYMIIFVMCCEVGLGKLNFDMKGFAQQQIASMNTYDQLLVEMAEKSHFPVNNNWPVEVRLLMMLTMNIVLFVVSNMIFKKTGTNLLGNINKMTGVNTKMFDTSENEKEK